MGKLNICFMTHVENPTEFDGGTGKNAQSIGSLACAIGAYGGKLSLQMEPSFASKFREYPLDDGFPTPLRTVLHHGGNFWPHVHVATYEGIESAYNCVRSLYTNEAITAETAEEHVIGYSGGAGIGEDWVSINAHLGLRHANSTAMSRHGMVIQSLRPYNLSDPDLEEFYFHEPAPGPIHEDLMTMRMRPFWANSSSAWFLNGDLETINPSSLFVNSVMVIPQAGRWKLSAYADGKNATEADETNLTNEDLQAALTEIFSALNLADTQSQICNVWYTNLPLAAYEDKPIAIGLLGDFVNSINNIGGTVEHRNMNEIISIFSSFNT